MQCSFELAGADFVGVAAVAVLAAEIRDRAAEIAEVAFDFGAERNAPAADVIARRVADALRRSPDGLVDPIAPFAFVLEGRVGILEIARQRSEEHTSELQSLMRHSYA